MGAAEVAAAREALLPRVVTCDWDALAEWFALGGISITWVGDPVVEGR